MLLDVVAAVAAGVAAAEDDHEQVLIHVLLVLCLFLLALALPWIATL